MRAPDHDQGPLLRVNLQDGLMFAHHATQHRKNDPRFFYPASDHPRHSWHRAIACSRSVQGCRLASWTYGKAFRSATEARHVCARWTAVHLQFTGAGGLLFACGHRIRHRSNADSMGDQARALAERPIPGALCRPHQCSPLDGCVSTVQLHPGRVTFSPCGLRDRHPQWSLINALTPGSSPLYP